MAITVIEATSEAQRAAFKATKEYQDYIVGAGEVTEGVTFNNVAEEGPPVAIYWILFEDERDEDNATYRINEQGVAMFHAGGVEI